VVSVIVATAFVLAGVFAVIAADAPDVIQIQSSLWKELTKGPVEFTHKKHSTDYKGTCTECHHVIKDGKNTWKEGDPVQKCQECHNEPTIQGEKKLSPDQQKVNLKIAFHDNCQGCHKKIKKDKPDTTAPVTCTGCHKTAKQ
jgi:hypothetical protein